MSLLRIEDDPAMKIVSDDAMISAWKRNRMAWTILGKFCSSIGALKPHELAGYHRARRDYWTSRMTLREGLRQRGGTWRTGDGITLALSEDDMKILHDDYGSNRDALRLAGYAAAIIEEAKRRYGANVRREAVAC